MTTRPGDELPASGAPAGTRHDVSGTPGTPSHASHASDPRIEAAIAANRALPGALLPVLHAIQHALGFVPPGSVPRIAHALNLSQAEVHGVITFYHDFRSSPPGRHVLKLCRAEACQAMGSEALEARLKQKLGIDWTETTPDGALTIEPVYCLGNCALSPALMIDGKLRGRITSDALDRVIDGCRRSPAVRAGDPGDAGDARDEGEVRS
jgi:formate dehydrogenase subunit gamma